MPTVTNEKKEKKNTSELMQSSLMSAFQYISQKIHFGVGAGVCVCVFLLLFVLEFQ